MTLKVYIRNYDEVYQVNKYTGKSPIIEIISSLLDPKPLDLMFFDFVILDKISDGGVCWFYINGE